MLKIAQPATQQLSVLYDTQKDGIGGIIGTGLFLPKYAVVQSIYQQVITTFSSLADPQVSIGSDANNTLYVPPISFIPGADVPTAMPGGVTGWIIYNYPQADGLEMKLYIAGNFLTGKCTLTIQYLQLPNILP